MKSKKVPAFILTAVLTAGCLFSDSAALAAEPSAETSEETGSEEGDIPEETAGSGSEAEDSSDTESAEDEDLPYSSDEIIIVYEGEALALDDTLDLDTGTGSSDATLEDLGVTDQETILSASEEQGETVLAQISEDASVEDLVEELTEDPDIAWVQPNYTYEILDYEYESEETEAGTLSESDASAESGENVSAGLLETTTDDPYATDDTSTTKNQYYLYSSGFTSAWDTVQVNGSVTVAVIDTGCNLEHTDLADNLLTDLAWDVTNNALLSESGVSGNGDSHGHGTMVCGVIAATANNGIGIAGASYNASLLPVRVTDDNGSATTSSIFAAYSYLDSLIEAGDVDNLRVINLSMGYYSTGTTTEDLVLESAITNMRTDNGVLTICAGGNGDGTTAYTTNCYPADFEACVAVTSVDAEGANSEFSDYNSEKDISAYGEKIYTTSRSGGYTSASGTSLASPQVAAAAALLWAVNSDFTPADVVCILQDTADEVTGNVHEESGSAGILDAAEAAETALTYTAGSNTDDFSDVYTIETPGKVTLNSAALSSALTSVTLKWSKVSGCTGYEIYRSVSGGSYKKVKTISGNSTVSWTNSSLTLGKTYKYKIRAYTAYGNITVYGSYSSAKSVTTRPSKVTISSAAVTTGGYVKVKWKKTSNAAGYVIYRSVNGGSYKKVKTITSKSTVSWTDKSVSAGRVYRYKIKSYQKSGSTTALSSSYSSVKKVTAKPAKVTITSVTSPASRTAKVKWKSVSGATGYQLAYRIKGSSTWHYITVKSTSRTITYLRNKNYYVKVRAYKTYNGKKYYGSWSSTKAMKVK